MRSRLLAILFLLALLITGCRRRALPDPASPAYRELCSAFYLGVAALESGEDVNARSGLTRATQIAPDEPAAWVDLGLLQARQQDLEGAYQNFERARTLAPENSRIESLLGLVESKRGKIAEAVAHYRKAVSLDKTNLRALYAWAMETGRQQNADSDAETAKLLDRILQVRPDNQSVQLDVIHLAAKRNDPAKVNEVVAALGRNTAAWPEPAKEQFARLQQAAAASDFRTAGIQVQFLRNTLVRVASYRRCLDEVKAPATSVGEPFVTFLDLPSPKAEPDPPDMQTRFEAQPLPLPANAHPVWIGALYLDGESDARTAWADASALHLEGGATIPLPPAHGPLGRHGILGADLNYDFKTDLVIAGPGGVRIYRQESPQHFTDVTAKAKLPPEIVNGAYTGAWAFDFDIDGDLDIVLGVPHGDPLVLRNNGDDTFTPLRPFDGVDGVSDFAFGDIFGAGIPDAAFLDASGKLHVFRNLRQGFFEQRSVPSQAADGNLALAAGDVDGDGRIDFVLLRKDGGIVRLSRQNDSPALEAVKLASWSAPSAGGPPSLLLADLDNNGTLDIVAGDQLFLGDGKSFAALPAKLGAAAWALADPGHNGRLDALGFTAAGAPVRLINRGAKSYNWQVIRTRAATATGDQRINPFGIGGEIEIRAGLFTQKQTIAAPQLHFGLGSHTGVEFARIVWPNGLIQTEFQLKADQPVLAQQRLKGSCPFLFAWDGREMRFLKDVAPMSAPLGAHLNASTLEPIEQTRQWFKIGGDQLVARDGYYDLRLTDEYWETYYIDAYSLMVVDHPRDTSVFVDERVSDPPAPLGFYVTGEPRPFASAADDRGRDVGALVSKLDAQYLDGFGAGQYQGLTRDHWVELELPADAPRSGPLYLIADGFLHPWDDTITMARSQGSSPAPQDLSIEVPDASGRWTAARRHLGIPAGRLKTVVLDLTGVFQPGAPRKLRLRTTMEVYWDRLAWAPGLSQTEAHTSTAPLVDAQLRYHGFSLLTQAGAAAPELARYDVIAGSGPRWRNLEGYYTRYGDVRELLAQPDDRIVIANSGDEVRMRFQELPPPPANWSRDYVFIGDGWMKEGDYNFQFSSTVLPLPYHGMKLYNTAPGALEQDKAYGMHPSDWQQFHTRYITPEAFERALWNRQTLPSYFEP